jgi:hypothetical protein
VKTFWLDDLITQLDTCYPASAQTRPYLPAPALEVADARQWSNPALDRRRRRKSALDRHKHIAEAFIGIRARSTNPEAFTYEALADRLEKASGRRFAVSTIQRRMKHWGIQDGMQRYKK